MKEIGKKEVRAYFTKCLESDQARFSDSGCILLISVGQKYHEGDKLSATISLMNFSFKKLIIMVCDSLQRHNMQNLTPQEAYQESLLAGDRWLDENYDMITRLTIPYKVIRWDEWLDHHKYVSQRRIIEELYENNSKFKEAVCLTIDDFISRRKKHVDPQEFNPDSLFKSSLEYLKEECTIMPLWAEMGCDFEAYPKERPHATSFCHKLFVEPYYSNLMKRVVFKFK